MQEDFKNQLQNTIGLWRKKGQKFVEEVIIEAAREAKGELRTKLSEQGIAENWTSVVNFVEEILPEIAPSVATLIVPRVDPLAQWLNLKIIEWKPYKIEISVTPQKHLQSHSSWEMSSLLAMAELSGRWLLEKHAPPGDFKIRVQKAELISHNPGLGDCTVRCELDSSEFEVVMAELMKNGKGDYFLPIMILSEGDVLMSQVNFHFALHWTPLLNRKSE